MWLLLNVWSLVALGLVPMLEIRCGPAGAAGLAGAGWPGPRVVVVVVHQTERILGLLRVTALDLGQRPVVVGVVGPGGELHRRRAAVQLLDQVAALPRELHLHLYRGLDQPVWEARALNAVGSRATHLGHYDTAREHCQAALTLHRHHHNPDGEADALDSLGYIEHHSGHHRQAIDHYRQALILFRDFGNTHDAANALDRLGHPHVALGQTDQARAVWREALELYREHGRHDDATRVQQQLDNLNTHNHHGEQLPPDTATTGDS